MPIRCSPQGAFLVPAKWYLVRHLGTPRFCRCPAFTHTTQLVFLPGISDADIHTSSRLKVTRRRPETRRRAASSGLVRLRLRTLRISACRRRPSSSRRGAATPKLVTFSAISSVALQCRWGSAPRRRLSPVERADANKASNARLLVELRHALEGLGVASLDVAADEFLPSCGVQCARACTYDESGVRGLRKKRALYVRRCNPDDLCRRYKAARLASIPSVLQP